MDTGEKGYRLSVIMNSIARRIRQLPLGALRRDGVWLSGPILNRGVIAWDQDSALQFGRLRLDQDLVVNGGRRWGLGYLNSGYVLLPTTPQPPGE